ncbi:type II toxin-antitoxin system HicB family antitoxin [Natronolimnobius baerhuensis]|uniref:Uncharacterized protein n=1 Tax=Natronolimnobius baerhuensis TaxID=253108 RepID=A0A202E5K6_9EURY|nr:hypothetical protein [Natronolimnobius baerhuensis]OVE83573.1 hypothetical protein B2G88_14135 [Natronolimnobius baerhuensis]
MSSDGDETETVDPDEYDELVDADVETWVDENGLHIAEDEITGVSSQGPDERTAVENLAAAVDTHREADEDTTGDDWL